MSTASPTSKFALRNFRGEPVEYYLVEERTPPQAEPQKQLSHLVVVLDRSGSMYGSKIADAKMMIEKVFTLEEFRDELLLVSLISYSSKGDVTTHFVRKPVSEVMHPGNRLVEEIRSIQATYLTCASQAVEEALKHVGAETTCLVLETDGFFNDPSPLLEQRAFDRLLEKMKPMKQLMVNAIAFGPCADFALLSKISCAMSGRCVAAGSIREVYDTVHDTAALLAGRLQPAVLVGLDGADYATAVSVRQRKVNGSTADLTISGIRPEDDLRVFRYRRVGEDAYDRATVPVIGDHAAVYAFARTKLAEGKLSAAKYAVVAARNRTLLDLHARALTPEQLTAFAVDLEAVLYHQMSCGISEEYGLSSASISVLELCDVLNENRGGFTVDLVEMQKSYHRRGLRRLNGAWVSGKFEPVPYDSVPTDDAAELSVAGFELNNQSATVNMLVSRPARLVTGEKGEKEVSAVAGVPLQGKMRMFRNYTLVGDGALNVDGLLITINDKALHAKLVSGKVIPNEVFDHRRKEYLPLRTMPVVPYNQSHEVLADDVHVLARYRVVKSILTALCVTKKGESRWSDAQLEALRSHGLTNELQFQPSTTTPYPDLEAAIRAGLVDSRNGYEVAVGTPRVPDLTDLYSANEYLARRYQLRYVGSGPVPDGLEKGLAKKPKMPMVRDLSFVVEERESKRTKLNSVDDLMHPIFQCFLLGIGKNYPSDPAQILGRAGVVSGDAEDLVTRYRHGDQAEYDALARAAIGKIDAAMERIYEERIRPLAFYIGASGLLPDNWEGQARLLTDEDLASSFPDLVKKKDASCFLLKQDSGDVVVTVSVTREYFSTEAGIAAARVLQAGTAS